MKRLITNINLAIDNSPVLTWLLQTIGLSLTVCFFLFIVHRIFIV